MVFYSQDQITHKRSVVKMVKIIMGLKGSGKTKKLVGMVEEAVKSDNGNVVVIEKERKLTYDIPHQARLIDAGDYDIGSYEFLKGLVCGLRAGNYDITNVFVDNFFKLVNDKDPVAMASFIEWLVKFSESEKIEFVISVSADVESCPESVKPYLI